MMDKKQEAPVVIVRTVHADGSKVEERHTLCHRVEGGDVITRDGVAFYYSPRGSWRYAK